MKKHLPVLLCLTACTALAAGPAAPTPAVSAPASATTDTAPTFEGLFAQCRAALAAKQTKDALALAERVVALAPENAEAHSLLGQVISVRMGEVNFMQQASLAGRMREAFERTVALDPDHVGGYLGLARYYAHAPAIAGGSRTKAEGFARELEKRDARLGALELGSIATGAKDWITALAHYERALALKASPSLHEEIGRVLEKLERPTEARTHYEAALVLQPDRPSAQAALHALN